VQPYLQGVEPAIDASKVVKRKLPLGRGAKKADLFAGLYINKNAAAAAGAKSGRKERRAAKNSFDNVEDGWMDNEDEDGNPWWGSAR
jgi:hypothetical protein